MQRILPVTTHTLTVEIPAESDLEQAGESVEIDVDEDTYLLWAARDAGLWLPADCQQGWCCTCAAELLEGSVDQSDSRRYYDIDRDAGLILPCTAKPRSNVRIRAEAYDEMLTHRADHDLPPGRSKLDR